MKKREAKGKSKINSFRIVPKEYIGYILLVGVLDILIIPGTIFLLITFIHRWDGLLLWENMLILSLPIGGILAIAYCTLSIIRICRGKVYLEVTDGILKFNGVLLEKSMNISNIKTIRKLSGYRQFDSISITRKIDKHIKESKRIRFPLIWFADRDIEDLLEYLNKANKKIEW